MMTTETPLTRKDIPEYDGVYQVSNTGEIRSLGNDKKRKTKILKKAVTTGGYNQVGLCKEGKAKIILVNRLVAQGFHGLDINNLRLCACHKDDNPLNNHEENIFVGTQKDNIQDMIKKNRRGGNIKLLKEDIVQIQDKIGKGIRIAAIASEFNVVPGTIYNIKQQKHVLQTN